MTDTTTATCAVCSRPVRAPLRCRCPRCALAGYEANQREARHAMRAQHQAQFMEHIAVIIDASLIQPNRRIDALGFEAIERRHTGTQAKIGRAIMANAGAGLGEPVNILLIQPNAMAERHVRPQQAQAVQIFHRRAAAAAARIFLLIGGFKQMHMDRRIMALRKLRHRSKRRV
jgi:hypothetical protein